MAEAEVAGTCHRPESSDLVRIRQHCLESGRIAAGCSAVAWAEEDNRLVVVRTPSLHGRQDLDL